MRVFIGKFAKQPWYENGFTYAEIAQRIQNENYTQKDIYTNSLFVLRELEMKYPNMIVYNTDNGMVGDINNVGEISMLQEELKQSDRYLDHK